jgi:hypothetical protein
MRIWCIKIVNVLVLHILLLELSRFYDIYKKTVICSVYHFSSRDDVQIQKSRRSCWFYDFINDNVTLSIHTLIHFEQWNLTKNYEVNSNFTCIVLSYKKSKIIRFILATEIVKRATLQRQVKKGYFSHLFNNLDFPENTNFFSITLSPFSNLSN